MQKQPSCVKRVQSSKAWVKICEIKGGSHEIPAMMLILIMHKLSLSLTYGQHL